MKRLGSYPRVFPHDISIKDFPAMSPRPESSSDEEFEYSSSSLSDNDEEDLPERPSTPLLPVPVMRLRPVPPETAAEAAKVSDAERRYLVETWGTMLQLKEPAEGFLNIHDIQELFRDGTAVAGDYQIPVYDKDGQGNASFTGRRLSRAQVVLPPIPPGVTASRHPVVRAKFLDACM